MRRSALALLLGCLLLVAGASALDGYDYYQTIEYAACDQETYQQDIVVHRTTGTAYNETAGGLETWHIHVGDHCQADYDDVRFTNSTGEELAYYLWPGFDSSSARFCVKLTGATSAGQMQVWYGNPSATTTSDGDATYLLHDHFDGTEIDPAKWALSNTVTVADSIVTAGSSVSRGDMITSLQAFGHGTMCQFNGKFNRGGFAADAGFWLSSPQTVAAVYADSSKLYADVRSGGHYVASGTLTTSTDYNLWQIAQTGSSIEYRLNGALVSTITSVLPSLAMPVRVNGYAAGAYAYADYILVRAYSATPPAATTFSGEHETAFLGLTAFPGLTLIPRDLAGTGLYTDINGNNRLDYNDLTVFFQHLAWAKTAQPIACFDFNGNGWLDYNDVITLFVTIMEEHT